MDNLPPLNALRAFEAAGRLQSIRRAADELLVTPGAVSRQVQRLETYLGVRLFRRDPREIVLTTEGEQYLAGISRQLDGIREETQKLTGRKTVEILRVRAYTTFAMKWLIPRLSSFHATNPTTEVRLTTSNETVDFDRENVDGAIRLGDGNWGTAVYAVVPDRSFAAIVRRFARGLLATFTRSTGRLATLAGFGWMFKRRPLRWWKVCKLHACISGDA
jgi:DNA-binding transcriptional LysR family regulator